MSGSQQDRDGVDPEETFSENAKNVRTVTFTETKTLKGKGSAFPVCAIVDTQEVEDENSAVTYAKGHVKWKCSGESGEPPMLMLTFLRDKPEGYTEIILGIYDYPQNPSEEFVTLPIDVRSNAEDIPGQWYLHV